MVRVRFGAVACGLILLLTSCATSLQQPVGSVDAVSAVNTVLDGFHQAASRADEASYFGRFATSGIFFGTDASERWSRDEFLAYAHPYFSKGKGWTFVPRDRHVYLSADRRVAWFDERLDSASYGECRGTGVLQLEGRDWKVEQYNLTIPIPNDLAKEFVARIREAGAKK